MHKKMYNIKTQMFLIIIISTLLSGCADLQPSEPMSETRLFLDTFCTITIHGTDDFELINEAFALIEKYEALFSITLEGSDIWRINNSGGEPVTVDWQTIEVIKAGLEFGELSEGMFDITIGRLTQLWDFNLRQEKIQKSHPLVLPLSEDISIMRDSVDFTQVYIDGNTVQLGNSDTWIDLVAIAKGYIGDKIAEFFIENEVSGALINLGGDVITVGTRQDAYPWRIALKKPFGEEDEWLGVIAISDASVIASGIYERFFEVDGIIYHHIIDPNTGMPVKSDVVSATVVAESALTGEGLSTIAVLIGSERAREVFELFPQATGMVLVLESGELVEIGEVELSVAVNS
jgi:thiamine biosynthesis lipoprotein